MNTFLYKTYFLAEIYFGCKKFKDLFYGKKSTRADYHSSRLILPYITVHPMVNGGSGVMIPS